MKRYKNKQKTIDGLSQLEQTVWELIFSFHHMNIMNIIEPPGKLGVFLSVSTLQPPDFSPRSSCAASTERLPEIIPYRTEERGGSCLPVHTGVSNCPECASWGSPEYPIHTLIYTKGVGPGMTLAWPGWKQSVIAVEVDTGRLETSRFKKFCTNCILLQFLSTEFKIAFNEY